MTVTGSENYATTYSYDDAQGDYTALLQKESKTSADETPLPGFTTTAEQTVYTYDANGSQLTKKTSEKTETNTYNALNQLVGFTNGETTASYAYNVNGLRYEKTVDGKTVHHVWDGSEQIIADVVESQFYEANCYVRGTNLLAAYSYNGGIKSEYTYYTQNAHGDVVNLTDAEGAVTKSYTYDAFGVEQDIDDSDTNVFRYCGEYFDAETGTVYLRARYYSPTTGRFISRDSYAGDNNDPLSLNLYTYCHNNPVSGTDSTGHFLDTFFDVASLVVDVVTFCIEPTPMGAVDIVADVAGLLIPGVPSAGLKIGVDACEAAYDTYKAVNTVHDAKKATELATTVAKNGDEIVSVANKIDINNPTQMQEALDQIVKAQHPDPNKGFSNTYALTAAQDGTVILSKNAGIPGPAARSQATEIFGDNIRFAGGRNANLDLTSLKNSGFNTSNITELHHAEARAVQYMQKNNIPIQGATQVVSRKSCESCTSLQYLLGITNVSRK